MPKGKLNEARIKSREETMSLITRISQPFSQLFLTKPFSIVGHFSLRQLSLPHRASRLSKEALNEGASEGTKSNVIQFSASRKSKRQRASGTGQVFIVGAGPGDAELLTLKALRLLQEADVVLFDALVSAEVLALIPNHVAREYVGKRNKKHSYSQDYICQRVVELAQQGKTVVRLKGGDPALFARTCEETDALHAAEIPFAIVPGVTAASGMSAYTGIPLTDRRCAQSVCFMTAHFKNVNTWPEMHTMAQSVKKQTVVVYMGLSRLDGLCNGLLNNGVSGTWPVAVVENATTKSQRVIVGTVDTIFDQANRAKLTGPTLLIFGKVVESRQHVNTLLLH
ncbi:MAG: uroporphyrinogen-III C-methyltransferase, partial [Pseudomonadota bacterium]|nr:uroporphyrinogen-III C-methyltransferase [Pseudomonadota bacterium]